MYHSDKPIQNKTGDLLGRKNFAKQLADSMVNLKNSDTITVALYGEWGSGKTSVINMMMEELNAGNNNPIIFNFEPWNFSDTNQLLSQFFIQLSNKFSSRRDKLSLKIGKALEDYSDAFDIAKLIPGFGNIVAYIAKKGSRYFGNKLSKKTKDISQQKNHIINLLEKQNNKIVVVIDDIDRLSNIQIRQIFQLITSIAKFPNIIYLLAFDKEIVVNALEKVQEGDGNEYLKKIIQVPIQLPDISSNNLQRVLLDKLNEVFIEYQEINFEQEHWQSVFTNCILPLIHNFRDINQLCNNIRFKLASIASEVDFADLVAISALEINYAPIFGWIKEHKPILTGEWDWSDAFMNKKDPEEWNTIYRDEIKSLIQEGSSEQDLLNTSDFLINYLANLFPYFGHRIGNVHNTNNLKKLRQYNQIAHPSKFDRYFYMNIDDVGLKSYEIKNVLYQMEYDDLLSFWLEKDKDDLAYELLEEIHSNIEDISIERAKILSESLFEVLYSFELRHDFLKMNIRSYAQLLIRELIKLIDEDDRQEYIFDFLNRATLNQLQSFADFFNITELSYGRLAAEGEERKYEKLISLQELEKLENVFCDKILVLTRGYNILDFANARMYVYLFEKLSSKSFEEYMRKCLLEDENKVKYITLYVDQWTGTGIQYEIRLEYEKLLNSQDAIEAIERLKNNKKYFDLPLDTQRRGVAFYLIKYQSKSYPTEVPQEEVDETLLSWKQHMSV